MSGIIQLFFEKNKEDTPMAGQISITPEQMQLRHFMKRLQVSLI